MIIYTCVIVTYTHVYIYIYIYIIYTTAKCMGYWTRLRMCVAHNATVHTGLHDSGSSEPLLGFTSLEKYAELEGKLRLELCMRY